MSGIAMDITYRFRKDISEKINRMPLRYFDRNTQGEVLSRITNDVDTVNQTLSQSLTQIVTSVVTVVGVLVMLLIGCQKAYYAAWEQVGKEKRHLLRDNVEKAGKEQKEASELQLPASGVREGKSVRPADIQGSAPRRQDRSWRRSIRG